MTDDPREILQAAGVECAEVETYAAERQSWYYIPGDDAETRRMVKVTDDAVLALARLVAEYKADADERERIMHGKTESGYVHYLGQLGPGDVIVSGGGGGAFPSDQGGTGGCLEGVPRIVHDLAAEEMDHE